MNANLPADALELRAVEQRRRLHNSVTELKYQVREKLDPKKAARRYLWPASAVAALLAVVTGYGFAGMFTRN